MERLTKREDEGIHLVYQTNFGRKDNAIDARCKAIGRLAAYEDTGLEPEEITAAIADAVKLISTMRNNKKAALWLKKYGPEKAGDTP